MDLLGKMRESRAAKKAELDAILAKETPEDGDAARADGLITEIREADERIANYAEIEARQDAAVANKIETGVEQPVVRGAAVVTREERTYNEGNDRTGARFVADVIRQSLGDVEAGQRLTRHMAEERVERGGDITHRAATTTALGGLVVPQYLTDLVAPYAKAGRPFADACRSHPMPAEGMAVNISRITTATTTAVQTQGSAVSETDIDDTLLTVNVQTNGGSQTVTRQAAERGTGALDSVLEDLATSYAATLDSTLLNQATNGLTNVATAITYTDASPTAAELYPKLLQAPAAVEAALQNQDPGATIAVMHSRRWYWIQSQLSSTFPLIAQPGVPAGINVAGANYGDRYGSGFRGVLPSGIPVIVDNNIATNLGAGTNEDEIYFVSANECHLWEDANAPLFIRTDTGPSVKSLGIDVVLYGYFAYTHARYSHAQKISGTGLVTPTWA